jgi:glutamate 5-kinase
LSHAAQPWRSTLAQARRVVVKVGSQVLCRADGTLDDAVLVGLCRELARLLDDGREVVLVSSGAVASGRGATANSARQANGGGQAGLDLGKQALAAIGQPLLMARWRQLFEAHGRHVAQVLLTHADLADRGRFLHARRVMAELMAAGVLPIVNENDTVAVDELKFGDNDALAAQVAHVVAADLVLLLTEVDGLYTADPRVVPEAVRLPEVRWQDPRALEVAGASTSAFGTGGMRSKVLAARSAGAVGAWTLIAHGKTPGNVRRALAGEDVGSLFQPAPRRLTGKRSWIASSVRPRGSLHVDAGAARALLEGGRSLLPIGVVRVEGRFGVGDPVAVVGPDGQLLGRGLVRHDSAEASAAIGRRTEQLLSERGWLAAELVHRDDFVPAR